MAYWTRSTKRQRGNVKAHVAKADGKRARREEDRREVREQAPDVCAYCDGEGNSSAGGACGFCDHGKPLDTQADWDATWGKTFAAIRHKSEDD